MKMIKNRNVFQKIIIILIFFILCNFIFPIYSRAVGGGSLLDPVRDLVLGLGDGAICIAQHFMLPGSPVAIDKKSVIEVIYEVAVLKGEDNNFLANMSTFGIHIASWAAEHIPGFAGLTRYGNRNCRSNDGARCNGRKCI